jgi:hypothetical protein
MNRSASDFHRHERVQTANRSFERGKAKILVWEHSESDWGGFDTEGNASLETEQLDEYSESIYTRIETDLHGLLSWFEPCFALGLFENVMQDSVMGIVFAGH